MSFDDWQERKWIVRHAPSRREVADLLAIVTRDIDESGEGRSADWRLAIDSLTLTIGWSPARVETLQRLRRIRNRVEYDRAGTVSERDVEEMRSMALAVRDDVLAWLNKKYPELL